ncbi:hypothetical protein GCM10010245_88160 [Streptomyces spectabilis]|uniref:DDE Tnp4 domain-containing protein n=1 Tax=Streptomyces spectabilis TaxID=68270 RepID=A0A7W8B3S9_STRST|nr:hypothetical protein [Streptomyces spectabilis]GGV55586.1 hypothetical protein GCM10010245_88160 [Streptomyces spectabilis]
MRLLEVLAAWAPGLHEALVGLGEGDFVIVDGTLIPTDRIKADEPYYSQKHKQHGMNIQAIARPDGTPLWFSRATPGRTHDLTAARAHGILQACLTRQILVLADRCGRSSFPHLQWFERHVMGHPESTEIPMGMTVSGLRALAIAESHVQSLDLRVERSMDAPDGEENIHCGRHHRDRRALVRRAIQERAGRVAGGP